VSIYQDAQEPGGSIHLEVKRLYYQVKDNNMNDGITLKSKKKIPLH
jgi:hypothetical protein